MVFATRCNHLKLKTLGDSDSALKFKADGGQEEDTMPFAPTFSRPQFFFMGGVADGGGAIFSGSKYSIFEKHFFHKIK